MCYISAMEIIISILIFWIVPLFVCWAFISSKWLNGRAIVAGFYAEVIAWVGLGCAALAILLWVVLGLAPVVATVTNAGFFGVRLDSLSATILLLVCFLGAVILRFSRNYLAGDAKQGHFFKWMCVTLGAVLGLVAAPGLVQFGLAWILTSLGLHNLLIYFPDRLGTLLSARKKFVVSRFGDVALLAAFWGLYSIFGTQDFGRLFEALQVGGERLANASWIGWLVVLGALLKSAQFPFHTWLPDTMGAPTPVSALMHAGIINGGGYLVVRLSPVLVNTMSALYFLAFAGALTAVYASMVMLSQTSVKRSLAYSTIAQMGFMLLQCGLGAFHLAILHIVAHSLYKGHAFLSSGSAVETAVRLNAEASYVALPANRIWAAVGIALGIVVAMSVNFGVSPTGKPGMLVLSMVVVMALTQLLWTQMRRGRKGADLIPAVGKAAGYCAIYFGLAYAAQYLLQSSLPRAVPPSLLFEVILTLLLFSFLITSIRFQDGERGFLSVAYKQRLYIHALNGFYMNTLANRVAAKMRLIPTES
jgi:NAD(P)H-quinone oxidoreductase subunit 5